MAIEDRLTRWVNKLALPVIVALVIGGILWAIICACILEHNILVLQAEVQEHRAMQRAWAEAGSKRPPGKGE